MAGSPPPSQLDSLSKGVQELDINGEDLPERYICKDGDGGVLDASLRLIEIPVIDLGLLTSSSTSGEEVEKLRSALSSWGCFQAINHGNTHSFLDEVREVTKQFFALPMEEKHKYSREANDIEGYGNDMILSDHQTLDWVDRLYLMVSPEDRRKLKFWPESPQAFREILFEYTKKLKVIVEVVLRAMAKSLNLDDENCFMDQYGEPAIMYARFNFYPPCPRPDLVLGLKPHGDGSAITILLQDKDVEGLQLLKDNQWVRVPIISDALLINIGDQIEIMTNGMFKSPVHRVVTNPERERISVAMFCSPDSDKEIKPADKLISDESPRLYKVVKDYPATYFEYYQQGKRPIDAVKI